MKSTVKVLFLCAIVLVVVSLACRVPGISSGPETTGLQSTIYVQQTQLAEKEGSSQQEEQTTAEPGGGLPPVDTGIQGDFEFLGQIGGSNYAVAADGRTACVGEGPRLVTLDVSDPNMPKRVGRSEVLPGLVQGTQMDGNYAYAATQYGGLHVLDISDPSQPTLVSTIKPNVPGCNAVVLADGLAYLACNPSGLFIVDISTPQNPVELSSGKIPGTMISLAVGGKICLWG